MFTFMGNHPVLTFFLAGLAFDTLANLCITVIKIAKIAKRAPLTGLTNQDKPPMKTMWVNVYRDKEKNLELGAPYTTEIEALEGKITRGYLCTSSIEIPDSVDKEK